MNLAFDLLLLTFNLSQLHNREKIIQLFVEGMQEIFKPAEFKYLLKKAAGPGSSFEIRTKKSSFGFIIANLPDTNDDTRNILINNAVQMLAVNLEHLDYEKRLEKERDGFELVSIGKLSEIEQNNKDLEETKKASLNLIEDLTDEIEKRRKAEESIKLSEIKFRNLFEHSPVGKSITGVDGSINVNKAFCNILGYSEDELKSKNWKDITHPDDLKMTNDIMQSLIKGERDNARFEKRYIHKNGNTVFTDVSSYLQRDTDGNPEYFITTINDITDRKQAEEELIKSSELIKSMQKYAKIGAWEFDVGTGVQTWSEEVFRILEIDLTNGAPDVPEGIGFIAPDFREMAMLGIQRAIEHGESYNQEWVVITEKGNRRWVNAIATPNQENGKTISVAGSFQDITDRKMAEESVLQEKKFNQAAIDSLPGLFYLFDEQGHYLRWNKNYEEVSGYSAEEISGMSPLDYFTEPDKSEIATAIQQVWTTGNTLVEGKFTSKNRTQKHYFFTGQLFWFEGKRCLIGMGIDITHRKQAEEELRKLNAVLEQRVLERTNLLARSNNLLVETGRLARVGGWEIDLITGKNYWSESTYKIHEVEPGFEPDTETAINFYAPESIPVISECVDRLINLGEPFDKELEFITAKKNRIWVRAIGEAYRENGKIVKIGGVFQDINSRKLVEEELKRQAVQLEASNKELEAFSYSVSHDLRAPLRAIHSFTNILREDYFEALGEEGKRICGIIESSSVHMGQLIDDLLSFSRFGRTELRFSKIDMTRLAKSVYTETGDEKLKENIDPDIRKLPSAQGDLSAIRQVFVNLISNALKYTSKTEKPSILIGCDKVDGEIVYFVKDNGVGFDMQYVNKLFGVFQRLHSAKEFEGNGVGLAIVQRIIHRHGGRVWAEGEVGKGAAFYFTIPGKDKRQK